MLASQLMRILETIPTDVKCETCVCDSAAQDMIMKENQNVTPFDSENLGRDTRPSPFEAKGTEQFWKAKFDDDPSMDNQNRTVDFEAEEFQNGTFCRLDSLEDDIDSESTDTNVKDEVQVGAFMHCNENGASDCRSPYVAASDLFERDKNLYTDKNVLDYERPELIVCYKEINYHVVKDICVDEGMPANRKALLDISEDDKSGNDDNRCKSTGDIDEEVLISNGLEHTSLDNTELPSERSSCKHEESIQKDGMNSGASSKSAASASEEESFVDNTLPIQDFGTRSFLRSFLNTLDGEESEVQDLRDQQFSGDVVSEELTAKPKEDVQKSILNYNSEVKTRSITFNFNSLAPVKEQSPYSNGKTELVKEQPLDSREMIDQNEAETDIHSARAQAEIAHNNNMNNENEAVVSLRRFDHGEASFSADSFVTHSGPIPFSGSLSLCSDGSATSGRSFAFPELQTEWNSSPVRMTAADRRRFRRHKGWRSGLLCCRF